MSNDKKRGPVPDFVAETMEHHIYYTMLVPLGPGFFAFPPKFEIAHRYVRLIWFIYGLAETGAKLTTKRFLIWNQPHVLHQSIVRNDGRLRFGSRGQCPTRLQLTPYAPQRIS